MNNEEPLLEYHRVKNDLTELFQNDRVSYLATNIKFLVVGTYSGGIIIYDHEGNRISEILQFHDGQITIICIDSNGEYIVSAAQDGTVVIYNYMEKEKEKKSFERPIKSMSIDPNFQVTNHFFTGSNELVFHRKTSLFQRKSSQIIDDNNRSIDCIEWSTTAPDYVAWCNDNQIMAVDMKNLMNHTSNVQNIRNTIVSVRSMSSVGNKNLIIPLTRKGHQAPADYFKSSIRAITSNRFLIGTFNIIRICEIRLTTPAELLANPLLPKKFGVTIFEHVITDMYIYGVLPWIYIESQYQHTSSSMSSSSTNGPKNSHQTSEVSTTMTTTKSGTISQTNNCRQFIIILTFSDAKLSTEKLNRSNSFDLEINGEKYQLLKNPVLSVWDVTNNRLVERCRDHIDKLNELDINKPFQYMLASTAIIQYQKKSITNNQEFVLPEDEQFFIVSPLDIIRIKGRDADDHIQWLLQHHRQKEAIGECMKLNRYLKRYKYIDIVEQYLKSIADDTDSFLSNFQFLLNSMPHNRNQDRRLILLTELWTIIIKVLLSNHYPKGAIHKIIDMIPVKSPKLDKGLYRQVFERLIETEYVNLKSLISTWPSGLISIPFAIEKLKPVIARLHNPKQALSTCPYLWEVMAILQEMNGDYNVTFNIYCNLKNSTALKIAEKYNLMNNVIENVRFLIDINEKETFDFLRRHCSDYSSTDSLSIINRLQLQLKDRDKCEKSKEYYLYKYYDDLISIDIGKLPRKFHTNLIELYIHFNENEKLNNFLRSSVYYDMEVALKLSLENESEDNVIYLYDRMGNQSQALHYILHILKDIRRAIKYCVNADDESLWHSLINESINNKEYVNELIKSIDLMSNPLHLLKKIERNMSIDNLRPTLLHLIESYIFSNRMESALYQLLSEEADVCIRDRYEMNSQGINCDFSSRKCAICKQILIDPNDKCGMEEDEEEENDEYDWNDDAIFIYPCNHFYHKKCSSQQFQVALCEICNGSI
ncbi:hypothetical protein SNEBB_009108 [Seison nebaliae]|nr:hypothetical protein SNEBB_009108 [Seison nebaliae]